MVSHNNRAGHAHAHPMPAHLEGTVTPHKAEPIKGSTSSGPTRPGRCHRGLGTALLEVLVAAAHLGPGPREGLCPQLSTVPSSTRTLLSPGSLLPGDLGDVLCGSTGCLGEHRDLQSLLSGARVLRPALWTWHLRVPWEGGSQPQLSLGAASPMCVCLKPFSGTSISSCSDITSWHCAGQDVLPLQLPACGGHTPSPPLLVTSTPAKGRGGRAARLDPLPKMKPRRHLLLSNDSAAEQAAPW